MGELMNKQELLTSGIDLMRTFCCLNEIKVPIIEVHPSQKWRYDVCAYYRDDVINLCLERCSHIGKAGRSWSYPGYVVDRTPYGVIQHELGHHVDVLRGEKPEAFWSDYSITMRKETGEPKLRLLWWALPAALMPNGLLKYSDYLLPIRIY